MALPQRKTDIGPPNYKRFLPPVIQKNYGNWKYHEILTPGTMVHVGESGDKLWTVRVASPRLCPLRQSVSTAISQKVLRRIPQVYNKKQCGIPGIRREET